MTAHNEQIVTAFEVNGLEPEQIADAFGLDVLAVKSVLLQNSSIYRKDSKKDERLQFTEGEAEEMKTIILNIARYTEDDPNLQFKAAKFILEDKKGRLDAQATGKQMNQFNFNVLRFEEQMKKALEARERTERKAIDVTSSVS